MEIDPLDAVASPASDHEANRSRLNTRVAITVALLATFMGICKVKDDNLVQAMQQAQADRVDHWSYYQAKNIRAELAHATADQLRAQLSVTVTLQSEAMRSMIIRYDSIAKNEDVKKETVRVQALQDQATYDALNYRDDQFDLSDAMAALAISMLAMTSLTQKRRLYLAALVPTALGVLMGLSGLFGWHIHSDALARLLS